MISWFRHWPFEKEKTILFHSVLFLATIGITTKDSLLHVIKIAAL